MLQEEELLFQMIMEKRICLTGTCWHMLKVTKAPLQEMKPNLREVTNRLTARTGGKLQLQRMSDLSGALPSVP